MRRISMRLKMTCLSVSLLATLGVMNDCDALNKASCAGTKFACCEWNAEKDQPNYWNNKPEWVDVTGVHHKDKLSLCATVAGGEIRNGTSYGAIPSNNCTEDSIIFGTPAAGVGQTVPQFCNPQFQSVMGG